MAKRKRVDPIEDTIETALRPGDFIGYNAGWSFVADLEEVKKQIEKVMTAEPVRAVDIFETFLAGCYEKIEELDDSGGDFGMFVDDLFCDWVKARQKAETDPQETAERLLAWMDDDPYSFAYQLERNVSKVLHKKGRDALARAIRVRFDEVGLRKSSVKKTDMESYERRRWGEALKTLYAAGRNVDAYLAICETTELLPADCEVVAAIFQARRKPEEALRWVERGLELEKSARIVRGFSYKLGDMKRALLTRLGRREEAVESAWQSFTESPHEYSYEELMKYVPKSQRSAWRKRALEIIEKADLGAAIGLLIKTKDLDLLVQRLRTAQAEELESLSHYTIEPVAKKLSRGHPKEAAKVYRALGMRILKAGKSNYYDAALSNFEQAKRCYEKAGLSSYWNRIVEEVREKHGRKYSFMPGFEKIIAGRGPSTEPSFLDRAKKRWKK